MRFRLAPVDTSFSFPDPAFPELKVADVYDATIDFLQLLAQGAVGIFYDGEHHLRRSQRDYDSQVWAILNQMGWRVLRVTNGMLDDPQWIVAHVTQLVAEARAEQITRVSRAVNRPRMSR